MSIHFEEFSLPEILTKDVEIIVTSENADKISRRIQKTNRSLSRKMKLIGKREKKSWQKSRLRNSKG
jgi:hypothetical protein